MHRVHRDTYQRLNASSTPWVEFPNAYPNTKIAKKKVNEQSNGIARYLKLNLIFIETIVTYFGIHEFNQTISFIRGVFAREEWLSGKQIESLSPVATYQRTLN